MKSDKEYMEIRERAAKQFLAIPGVHAIGIGGKETAGKPTGEVCIKVFVIRKKRPTEIPPEELIPAEFEGIKTDIIEMPVPTVEQVPGAIPGAFVNDTSRYRPLKGGTQVNRRGSGFGTLGCFARVTGDANRIIAITNHHVVFPNCADLPGNESAGQPEATDSCTGCCSSVIGKVVEAQCDADVDIALIQLDPGLEWLAEVEGIGVVTGAHTITAAEAATLTYQVKKRGRTTGLTGGTVQAIGVGGTVNKPDGTVHRAYVGAISCRANPDPANPAAATVFAAPGDSGSAILNSADQVVGIQFGASGATSVAIPVNTVITKFQTGIPAARQIPLTVATAAVPNDVQTVPGAAFEAIESEATAIAGNAELARLERELRESELGRIYSDLYLKHFYEVNDLINRNRRVATVWHRSGAAALFQSLVRAFHTRETRVPKEINGASIDKCIDSFIASLLRFGSLELCASIRSIRPGLPDISGRTYPEMLGLLKAHDPKLMLEAVN